MSDKTIFFAHRGAHNDMIPENSLLAFKRAIELEAQGVEFDIRRTKDGVIVINHDDYIDICDEPH